MCSSTADISALMEVILSANYRPLQRAFHFVHGPSKQILISVHTTCLLVEILCSFYPYWLGLINYLTTGRTLELPITKVYYATKPDNMPKQYKTIHY